MDDSAPETASPSTSVPPSTLGATTQPGAACSCGCRPGDELSVPFWIMLAGFGVGAFWALAGVGVGRWLSRR